MQFNADIADGLPWKFTPTQRAVIFYFSQFRKYFHLFGFLLIGKSIFFLIPKCYSLYGIYFQVKVKPGQSTLAFFTAENLSSKPITGVSTYNVTPMKVNC